MSIVTTEGVLLAQEEIVEFSKTRSGQNKSDHQLAEEYTDMIEGIYLHVDDLDETACPPDRRFFKHDKEAWIYEHGNIIDVVFVIRD